MADSRYRKLDIKSGPQRIYEFLLDKPVGYRIAEHTHRDHIPLHTGKLSSALSGLEEKGAVRAVHRELNGNTSTDGRRMRGTVFEWFGPVDDIKFSGGHRPRQARTPGDREGICPRKLPRIDAEQTMMYAPGIVPNDPRVLAPLPIQPPAEPPAFLPPAPTLSEQLLLLAIQIDRARKPGTPSAVFRNSAPLREVALPSRVAVVERLLELATLAEQLEAERRPEPAAETVDAWRY